MAADRLIDFKPGWHGRNSGWGLARRPAALSCNAS